MGGPHASPPDPEEGARSPLPSPTTLEKWIAALMVATFLAVAVAHFAAHDDLETHAQQGATSAEAELTHAMLTT